MENWTTVFWYEVLRQLRRPAYLFTTLGLPALAFLIFGGYLLIDSLGDSTSDEGEAESTLEEEFETAEAIGFVDATGFFDEIDVPPLDTLVIEYDDMATAETALAAAEIGQLYFIDADYFETGVITQTVERINLQTFENGLLESYLIVAMAGDNDPLVVSRLRLPLAGVEQVRLNIDEGGDISAEESNFGADFVQVYVFALLLMFATLWNSSYLLQSLVDEKENYMLEIILTSVKPFPLLLGKTLAMGTIGLIQITVWLVSIFVLAQLAAEQIVDLSSIEVKPVTLVVAVIYFLLGYGFTGGLYASIAAFANTTREGSQIGGFLILPLITPLIFITVFIDDPNGTIARVLSLIPVTAPLAMVMRTAITDVPLLEIIASMVSMCFLVVFSIWMAGRLFRVTTLLRGSKPKLREVPQLLLRG